MYHAPRHRNGSRASQLWPLPRRASCAVNDARGGLAVPAAYARHVDRTSPLQRRQSPCRSHAGHRHTKKRYKIYFLLVKLQSRLWGRRGQSVQECCSATYTSYSLYHTHQYSLRTCLYYFQARQPNWRPKKHNNNNKKEKPKQLQKKNKMRCDLVITLYKYTNEYIYIYIYIL